MVRKTYPEIFSLTDELLEIVQVYVTDIEVHFGWNEFKSKIRNANEKLNVKYSYIFNVIYIFVIS